MTIDWKALAAPFPPDAVSWRVGSISKQDNTKAKALAYLDARDVMNRLDAVAGPANWQCRYSHAATKTVCDIAIRVDGEWVWKADGAGDTDIEAEKGSLSDAFKRAAVRWGIGRYLYDLPSPWVAINKFKQIEDSEHAKLRALLAKDARQGNGPSAPSAPSAPPPAPKAPPPALPPSGKGSLFWIEADGTEARFEKGSDWFAHALKKLRAARDPAPLWATNGRVANEIVERAPDHTKGRAEELRDQCIRAVDDARDLTAAA
jgi:hypothetical protein